MKKINKKKKVVERSSEKTASPWARGIIYLRPNHWTDRMLAHETLCRTFADQTNVEIVDTFCDDGEYVTEESILESAGFNKALDYCRDPKNKVEALIVVGRDHLGTNTSEYLRCKIDLHAMGVEILSATNIQPIDCTMEHICEITEEYKRLKKV